jgi:hypothetical protein
MLKKMIEFCENGIIKEQDSQWWLDILELSKQGKTLEFIDKFNSLDYKSVKFYSKFKINLYDIN